MKVLDKKGGRDPPAQIRGALEHVRGPPYQSVHRSAVPLHVAVSFVAVFFVGDAWFVSFFFLFA